MAKKKLVPIPIEELAQQLLVVRKDKATISTLERNLSDQLKKRMKGGEKQGLFKFVPTTSVIVTDIKLALEWALQSAPQLVTVDTTRAKKLFQMNMTIPDGFEVKVGEQLREQSADDKLGENEE